METIFIISSIVAVIFSVIKVIESKYIDKKIPAVKYIIRDGIIAFISVWMGLFGYIQCNGSVSDLFNIITDNKIMDLNSTQVFTDEPGF